MKTKTTWIKPFSPQPVYGGTASPRGVFDTSARLDARAALMKNMTSPIGVSSHNWDTDRANAPTELPDVSDQPE